MEKGEAEDLKAFAEEIRARDFYEPLCVNLVRNSLMRSRSDSTDSRSSFNSCDLSCRNPVNLRPFFK